MDALDAHSLTHVYVCMYVYSITLGFFCLAALDLMGELETALSEQDRLDWIEWIYAQQVLPTAEEPGTKSMSLEYNVANAGFMHPLDLNKARCGFRGSSFSGIPFDPNAVSTFIHACMFFLTHP